MNIRNPKAQLRVNNPDAISDIDALEPIQSQYSASPRMVALLVRIAALYDLAGKDAFLWYWREFNPRTATGHGLDVWARIVGATRQITLIKNEYFGWKQSKRLSWQPEGINVEDKQALSGFGIFYRDQDMTYQDELADDSFRDLIFWKAAVNIGRADAELLNSLLRRLFHGKTIFVLETGTMAIRVVSRFELNEVQRAIFRQYGIAGRGAGVYVDWLEIPDSNLFGFTEVNLDEHGDVIPDGAIPTEFKPFDEAPFFNGRTLDYQPQ